MMRANLVRRVPLALGMGVWLFAAACSSSAPPTTGIVVSISPTTAYVPVSSSLMFAATVSGSANALVVWSVNNVVGGNATLGFIESNGFYRAPAAVPTPNQVTVTVTSQYGASEHASATVTIVQLSSTAQPVQVASGQTISNINLQVSALTPTLSIYAGGTCSGSSCTTAPTGAQVAQGSSASIYLVGSGLIAGTVYSISGPASDVAVTQPAGAQFGQTVNGTPTVTFDISVSAQAVPGLRNIMVSNPATGELSVFVGGLQIATPEATTP